MNMDGMGMQDQLLNVADPAGIAIVVGGVIATALSFALTFRWFIWPGETAPDHPKCDILREDR